MELNVGPPKGRKQVYSVFHPEYVFILVYSSITGLNSLRYE